MHKEINVEEAFNRASSLCATTEKCAADIMEKLRLWGASEEDCEAVIQRLVELNFIDEERYARAFVKDKFRFNKWGKVKIAMQLRHKKISESIILAVLEEIDEEDYLRTLHELLQQKARSLKYKDQYDKQAKLYRFALSRGFELESIKAVYADIC